MYVSMPYFGAKIIIICDTIRKKMNFFVEKFA
jgi:hypothetical protein